MQITDRTKEQWDSWLPIMEEFLTGKEYENIIATLKAEVASGKVVSPASKDLYRSFSTCDRHSLKAVIIMYEPYNIAHKGAPVSNGIPLDSELQSSLVHYWNWGIEKTYGFMPDMDQHASLEHLLKQGVLLIHSSWTTYVGAPYGAHKELWRPMMQYICRVLNENFRGLPIVLLGGNSQSYEQYIDQNNHYVLKCEHMLSAQSGNRLWDYKDMYRWVNDIIEANNGPEETVKWWQNKVERKFPANPIPPWIDDRVNTEEVSDLPF